MASSAPAHPPSPSARATNTAIVLMATATMVFSVLDASAKYLGAVLAVPLIHIVWWRFLGHVAFTGLLLGPKVFVGLTRSTKPGLQVLRSVFMLGATGFNFWAVQYLQLDQTITIFFLTPLIVAALAGPILGEWIGWRRLLAVLAGFVGVLVMTRPGLADVHWAFALSFAATLSYALYNIITRYLAAHDPAEVTQVFSPVAGLVIFTPLALAEPYWPSGWLTWGLLALVGLTGTFGHWLLILAHRRAPAPVLAPFVYTGLISMTAIGYFVFGDVPDGWTIVGGAIIIGSGLYIWARERALARKST